MGAIESIGAHTASSPLAAGHSRRSLNAVFVVFAVTVCAAGWSARAAAEAYLGFKQAHGDEHPSTQICVSHRARLWNSQQRYEESADLLRKNLALTVKVLGEHHWRTGEFRSHLGEALAGLKQYEEAEKHLTEGYADLVKSIRAGRHTDVVQPAIRRLVHLYQAWGKPDRARQWGARLAELSESSDE